MREKEVTRCARPEIQNRDVHGDDIAVAALEPETAVVHGLPPRPDGGDRAALRAVTVSEGGVALEMLRTRLPDDGGCREPEYPLGALLPEHDLVGPVLDEDFIL